MNSKRSLGLRAEAQGFYWAIVDGSLEHPALIGCGALKAPDAYSEGESLTWIREQLVQVIEHYRPFRVAVRFPERTGFGEKRETTRCRLRVEGVLLDVVNSKISGKVLTGALNTISKHLGVSAKDVLASKSFNGLDLSNHKGYIPEAILAAAAVLASY